MSNLLRSLLAGGLAREHALLLEGLPPAVRHMTLPRARSAPASACRWSSAGSWIPRAGVPARTHSCSKSR
jgi:hypothetical protein